MSWLAWLFGKKKNEERCHSCDGPLGEEWSSVILAHEDEWGHDTESEYKMCGKCSDLFEEYRVKMQGGRDDSL